MRRIEAAARLCPHLLGRDTGSALLAGKCSLDGRLIERALAPMRSNVSAGNETSDGAMDGRGAATWNMRSNHKWTLPGATS